MSLAVLANTMARHGRGPDTTLVHMSPREVNALQSLAQSQGGSLTVNPHTGLPEAGILDTLLPAVLGAAVDTFVPGFGSAIGSALGVGQTAGTAIGLGGLSALASGDLNKGLQTGLGAYGGAGLAGLAGFGPAAEQAAATTAGGAPDLAKVGAAAAQAQAVGEGNTERMGATDIMKKLGTYTPALALAALAANQQRGDSAPKQNPGYIRRMAFDPNTGTFSQQIGRAHV